MQIPEGSSRETLRQSVFELWSRLLAAMTCEIIYDEVHGRLTCYTINVD